MIEQARAQADVQKWIDSLTDKQRETLRKEITDTIACLTPMVMLISPLYGASLFNMKQSIESYFEAYYEIT